MPKFMMSETIHSHPITTVRLGTTSVRHTQLENGKALKLSTLDNYVLAAAGDPIQGVQTTSNLDTQGTVDGYAIGGVANHGTKLVIFDGLEATPGTGTVAIGDFVVTGTVTAFGTALPGAGLLKVCKATNQPGTAVVSTVGAADTAAAIKTQIDAALAKVANSQLVGAHAVRVVSLGTAGTGAVGTTGLVEFL